MALPLPDSVPRRRRETRARKYGTRLFVVGTTDALELDAAGEFIFRQIDGTTTVRRIAERIAQTYLVGFAEAMADSTELLAGLAAAGVIDIETTADA
jgi:hypothetical protein